MTKISADKTGYVKELVSAEEKKSPFDFLDKEIKFFGSGFNDKKKERFYSEFSILFAAGVDIRSSLELIEEEQVKEKDKAIISSIMESVIAGQGLSTAMLHTGHFSDYEIFSLRIGEESGKLNDVLRVLSDFF
ncbi:MAG: type II secretion system F family protein [Bacteroidia bacterium]